MKIGIDISQIIYEGTGVANYTRHLVENLLKIDQENQYLLFFSSLRRKFQLNDLSFPHQKEKQVILKKFKFPPSFLHILWNKLHVFPIQRLIGPVDLFHSSDWIQPPTMAKKITTIHDLTIFRAPESQHPQIIKVQKLRLERVKSQADFILCDSLSTKKDIIKFLNIPAQKIKVIYLAADEIFKPEKNQNKIKRIKSKYNIKGDYLLSVATREPRKNLGRTIKAFQKLKQKNLQLVLVGKYGWGKEAPSVKNIIKTGFISQEDLPILYSAAKAFIYPSLYEGFGLPVLESLSCGCPVITSNLSSLPEIADQAAILVNPLNTEEISRAIYQILYNNQLANHLRQKGLKQAQKFSWQKTATQTLKTYEELITC